MYLRQKFDTLNELLDCLEQNDGEALIPMFAHLYEHEIAYHAQGKEEVATYFDGDLHVVGPGSHDAILATIHARTRAEQTQIVFYRMDSAEEYFITTADIPTMPGPKRDM